MSGLLHELADKNVELWLEADRLRFRAPDGAMTPELRSVIAAKKTEIIEALRTEPPVSVPLSANQQSLLFLHRTDPDSPAYTIGFAARVRSSIDTAALRKALQGVIDRHPMLRTTCPDGPELLQVIAPHTPVSFDIVDARGWTEADLRQAVEGTYRAPFDLATGPVFRATLFTRAADDAVLLLAIHHIAADGWSVWLILDELRALYQANTVGGGSPLPRPQARYTDFIHEQADLLAGEEGERLWTFWRDQLTGDLTPLDLPADRPRPPVMRSRGATVSFGVSEHLTAGLKRVAREEGTTLFTVLLSAFYILLSRYSGRDDLIVGTPVLGRHRPEWQGVVGDFVNTVPLRARLSGNPSFRGFLASVKQLVLDAMAHDEFPFTTLVQRLGLPRDISRSPLVQTLFVMQKAQRSADLFRLLQPGEDGGRVDFGGLALEPYLLAQQEGQFDLTLEVVEAGASLVANLKYDTDLFDRATIVRLQSHLETLLGGILESPDASIQDLPIVPAAEIAEHLTVWNHADATYPTACLHRLFEAQAAKTPTRTAVTCDGASYTYAELNARSNQLARRLREFGVGPDVLVGISVERSLHLIVGLLGILKSGAAYLPMDPVYPADRKAFMLEDAGAAVVLVDAATAGEFAGPQAILRIDEPATYEGRDAANLEDADDTQPQHLAYVIYTSGSTGRPKGVQVTHANVARLMTATDRWYAFSEQDVWTLFHSFAFDFSVWEIWGALLYGGRLVVVPYLTSRSPEAFYALLADEGVTVLNQTPSAFRQLIAAEGALPRPRELALRYVIFGGEALDLPALSPWVQRHGDARPHLINMYGITETTVHVTYRRITKADIDGGAGSVIGVPIPDLQLYILDEQLRPVPVGVPGEMYVGGAGVARGYLNRPELTAQRFIVDPFTSGGTLYRTGDLARRRHDGDLEYLGRLDQQVKIRGFRIELGEIEQVLAAHPSVKDAVVVAHKLSAADVRLVAFAIARNALDERELQRYARERLPDYMVPSAILEIEAFPLTSNGKLDRAAMARRTADALAERARNATARPDRTSDGATAVAPPRTAVEEMLAAIWADVLGVKRIGSREDFFDAGGHSLLAVQLMRQLAEIFWIDLPLRTLFEAPTVEQMARIINERLATRKKPDGQSTDVLAINAEGSRPPFVFLHAALEGDGFYCYNLARYLGPDQPLYALPPLGLDGAPVPGTIEEMAVAQLTRIRAIQPRGPYYIGGFCASGLVAYEIARRLRAAGEQVPATILVDSYAHDPDAVTVAADRVRQAIARAVHASPTTQASVFRAVRRVGQFLRNSRRRSLAATLRTLARTVRGEQPRPVLAAGGPSSSNDQRMSLFYNLLRATDVFVPKPYDGSVTCLLAQESRYPVGAWQRNAPQVDIRTVAGDHTTCITTRVESLGTCLREVLQQAQSRADCDRPEPSAAGAAMRCAVGSAVVALLPWLASILQGPGSLV